MKHIYALLFLMLLFVFSGCSKDDDSTGADPFGGNGGGGDGTPTFTVTIVTIAAEDGTNQDWFKFTPNTGVTIQRIAAKCEALNVDDAVEDVDIPDDIFSATYPLRVGPITLTLQQGQKWIFTVTGKVGSTTGKAYSSTVNYTVQ